MPHSHSSTVFIAVLLTAALSTPSIAVAQDYVPDQVTAPDKRPDGWDFSLSIGATVNLTANQDVVGQPNGNSWTLGGNAKGGADYISGNHESRNTLVLNEVFTRTPNIDEFVRTLDEFVLESIYYYRFESTPWFGPFVRLRLDTSFFEGFDVREGPVEYSITRTSDPENPESVTADRLRLTDNFQPLFLKESIGLFARPLSRKFLDIEFRLGVGARQVFADGLLVIDDDDATEPIEVVERSSFNQAGGEAVFIAKGSLVGKRVTYSLNAEALIPLLDTSEETVGTDERSALENTNIEVTGQLSFKLVEWASLDYQLRVLRVPQIQEDYQIQNTILLTFAFTLLESDVEEAP